MNPLHVMSNPRHIDIAITGKCNLACKYCFYADEMVKRNDLPTERWLDFFNELGKLRVMTVSLTGGEVFTRRDLFKLIDGVIANHMRYSLLSNGTLITENILEKFRTGKRYQRLNSIQISIDGSQENIHNASRPNSFERALRGLRLLVGAGFPVSVRVTVNRYNVDDLDNIARLLLEDIGLPYFSTSEAFPCGATDRVGQWIILTPEQRNKAMHVLYSLEKHYPGRIQASAGPLAKARGFAEIEARSTAGKFEASKGATLTTCGGVFSQLAILHDGTIVPCHNLSTVKLGKIGSDNLQEIWLEHPGINSVRQRSFIKLDSLETCRGCNYQGVCGGGCPGIALFLTGDVNNRNPLDCLRILKGEDPYYSLDSISSKEAPKNGK